MINFFSSGFLKNLTLKGEMEIGALSSFRYKKLARSKIHRAAAKFFFLDLKFQFSFVWGHTKLVDKGWTLKKN